jgi:hypothetical protein
MLYLHPHSAKIIKAKRGFHVGMRDFVLRRIDTIRTIEKANISQIETFFDLVINDEIDNILIGEPRQLASVNSRINPLIQLNADIKKGIEHVFNYDLFIDKCKSRYDAYDLAESLDINTCTYCNRNYTNTVITRKKRKITRPEFDHFFDKGTNPLLAISFYNLIPSCSICNSSVKGSIPMSLANHLHPYLDNNIDNIKFSYKYSKDSNNGLRVKVVTTNPSKEKNTVEVFALEEMYNSHTSELLDLIKTKQYFSDRYLSILTSNLLKHVIVSKEDLYRIVFGTEYNAKDFINRPFSKFKSDILKELGII